MVKIGRESGYLSLEAGAAGEASDDEDGRLRDKSGAPSIEGTTCSAQHSPLGLAMMLKAGWKPGQALGRDPGTPPMTLTTLLLHMLPSVGDSEHSFSVLSGSVFFPSETMVCSEFFKAMFQIVSEVCVNIQKEGSR